MWDGDGEPRFVKCDACELRDMTKERDAALRGLDAVRAELNELTERSGCGGSDTHWCRAQEQRDAATRDANEAVAQLCAVRAELAAIKARRCGTCKWWRHCEPDGHGECRRPYPQECSGWVGGSAWEGQS